MQLILRCFRVGVVVLFLAPPTLSFSRGASHASCQEMIPGHIRAQPLDPQHSHVTLRTSASSYLPGQLVTVTVRSSRDFMGFLLQARSAEAAGGRPRVGFRPRTGVRAGVRSSRLGPVLVGGSWTLAPPGTHTLRCLSEGDTLTHSDKQLKRNLSFVWRAPDAPMGDIRFYITVVQSYFVYWAGIQSTVLRDGSHAPWSGSNITEVDGGNSTFALQEDEALAAPRAHQAPSSQETPPVLKMSSSSTSAALGLDNLTNQTLSERNQMTSGSLRNATTGRETDTYSTSGSFSGVTEEAGTDRGSPVAHTKNPKSSLFSSIHLPVTVSLSSAEMRQLEAMATLLPNITMQNSTSPRSLVSFPSLKFGKKEIKETQTNVQDPKPPTLPGTTDTTLYPEITTTAILSTNHSFHNTNLQISTSQNPRRPIQDQSSSVKVDTKSSSSQPWKTNLTSLSQSHNPSLDPLLYFQTSSYKPSASKPLLQSRTVTSLTFPFQASSSTPISKSQTSPPNLILPSKSPVLHSFLQSHATSSPQPLLNKLLNVPSRYQPVSNLPKYHPENSSSEPKTTQRQTSSLHLELITTTPLSRPSQPQPSNSFSQALLQTISTQTEGQITQSKSDTLPQPWPQPRSQTGAPQAHTFGWNQTQTTVIQSIIPLPVTSKIKTMRPIFTSTPSVSPFPALPHTLPASSLVDPGSTTPPYRTRSSVFVSKQTSFTHASYSSSHSSSSMTNQPKTAPALSDLPSPSPISIPPHYPSIQPSPPSPVPSYVTSSTTPSLNSSQYPSSAPFISSVPLSTSSSSPFTSLQSVTSSTFTSHYSSTISPALSSSSSSSSSSTSSISSAPSPPSPSSSSSSSISTSPATSSSNLSATSSLESSPHPEPSPAPRRSLHHPLTSTSSPAPSQQFTRGQRLAIQNHITSSDPEPNLNLPTPRIVVHPNPEPHPNLDPFNLNLGPELKPNPPNTEHKRPSKPSGTPDKEGKYPDITPRYSTWELGMLLGCSAGLGMVLVVGVRYMYRQACGKRTEVTLNDRDREYGRGEQGVIHVQECGDLVRVRRIRENSFVLLAEYDILASPGD